MVLRFSAGDSLALEAFEVAFKGFGTTHAFLLELCRTITGSPIRGIIVGFLGGGNLLSQTWLREL